MRTLDNFKGRLGRLNPFATSGFQCGAGRTMLLKSRCGPGAAHYRIGRKADAADVQLIDGGFAAHMREHGYAAACMLAVDLAHEDRIVAVMDIGTNTELIVGNRHKVLAASCPAGPAFEGGQISFGMPGLPGAIEKVAIADDGSVRATTIGNDAPEGICGSGLVDLMSELLRTGRMNHLGRFQDEMGDFVVKAANVAGLQIAFAEYGITFADLDVFYLAGGFGRYLNID